MRSSLVFYYAAKDREEVQSFVLAKAEAQPTTASLSKANEGSQEICGHVHFRFLDLFPEIRNLNHRELLTWPKEARMRKRRCWPQILATCRQIKKEAGRILYEENPAPVEVVMQEKVPETGGLPAVGVAITCGSTVSSGVSPELLWRLHFTVPAHLRKLRSF